MRQRVISSVGVVLAGVVPIILGGPIFALLMVGIGVIGYQELRQLMCRLGSPDRSGPLGFLTIIGLGLAALLTWPTAAIVALITLAVFAPLVVALASPTTPGAVAGASITTTASLYLALPVFSAIALRGTAGRIDQDWLARLSSATEFGWPDAPRGLAWVALVVFSIWVGDSVAYLAGRSLGRLKLAPQISPNKTIEGSAAGLAGSAITASLCAAAFGLDLPILGALAIGATLGVAGQVGDLVESLLKRQAGVKDSGTLIPGHGGMLDRVDALLLAFPVAWCLIALVDGSTR